ncbi:MAG: bifunctional phosphopantothenoylcysteine decarboxylase/phosphopantothenate--cysteine ligase CoaBC [Chitinophagales bacterium]
MLKGKKILIGLCGSIAAYKTAFLIRTLVKQEAEVRVIMTASATEFITPLTLSTLSKNPVLQEFKKERGEWNNHVELGLWADLMLIAPTSANTIAKLANGLCDNLLCAVYLSAKCPVFFAPAMDMDMWKHPATQSNIQTLKSYGDQIIPVEKGELASGLEGEGRMAEPENIVAFLENHLTAKKKSKTALSGKNVLITAGPTQEAIDPVRYISNHSSGKMGLALAQALQEKGAKVHLIIGPHNLEIPEGIKVYPVTSTLEMLEQADALFEKCTIGIFAAAVSDYRPANVSSEKIKKSDKNLQIELTKNPDILKQMGKKKKAGQILVGFALETNNAESNALKKLKEKNLDFIVLNSLSEKGAGFAFDTNKISIFSKNGSKEDFPLKSKDEVADDIISAILKLI